jgi:DNA-binding beta-propeller fold protein YncE
MAGLLAPTSTPAQIIGVAVDPKARLVEGEPRPPHTPPRDFAVFLEFHAGTPRELGRVYVPTSFMGPPAPIVISSDGVIAVTSASSRLDPADADQFAESHTVSVVNLAARPIRVTQTLDLGAAPSSLAMSPSGKTVVAMLGGADSIAILAIEQGKATLRDRIAFEKGSRPLAAAFAPDGRTLLISFSGSNRIGVFAVKDEQIQTPALRELSAGIYPTAIAFCGHAGLAVVSNYGRVTGDADTISLNSVDGARSRVIDTATVGPAPEGATCSHDGKFAAAAVQNMSTVASSDPNYSPHSLLKVFRIDGARLQPFAEARIGAWAQGVGFTNDSRTIFAESIADRALNFFRLDERGLSRLSPIVFDDGGPVGHGISGH